MCGEAAALGVPFVIVNCHADEHVLAARVLGTRTPAILVRHVLPLIAAPLLMEVTRGVAGVILAEAGCCGRTMISKGLLRQAARAAARNVEALLPLAARGIPIAIVNRGRTRGDDLATVTIDNGCSPMLALLADELPALASSA
mgnify:CR=1 FL=1